MPKAQCKQFASPTPGRRRSSPLRHTGRCRGLRLHRLRFDSAITEYLADVRARRSAQAADRLAWLFADFRRSCTRRHLSAINRRDLISYMAALRDRGLADRTIFNRISTVRSFLRHVSGGRSELETNRKLEHAKIEILSNTIQKLRVWLFFRLTA